VLMLVGALALPAMAGAQGTSDAYFEFLMARRFEAAGDAAGAQAALERATRADPRSSEIWAELAAFHLRRSQPEEAERAAKSSLAIDEMNFEAHRALGLVYAGYTESSNSRTISAQQKAYIDDAIRHLERAAGGPSGGSDLVLNYTLGRLYLRDGTPAKAVQSLTRSLNQNPGSVQLRLSLAQAYAGADDLKGAVNTLEEIVDDEPRVAAALAVYQEQSGLFAQAAVTYTKALAVQPMNRELKFRRISALQSAKDHARAASLAGDARKQHPEDARFARLQGRSLFDGGDRSGGISVLESAARAFPKDIPTQYDLADIYRDAGRDLDAEKALRQILATEPGHANALNYLGYLLALRGVQLDEAVQLVRRALDTEPTNGAYLDSLGWVHYRRGEFAEAEKYLNAAAERMPGNSEVYDHLGDVHAKRGRWQDAIAAWTRALEGDLQDVDAATIEKKIADAKSRVRR
jgi:tetratricopeptide (TPR) repeat protein